MVQLYLLCLVMALELKELEDLWYKMYFAMQIIFQYSSYMKWLVESIVA